MVYRNLAYHLRLNDALTLHPRESPFSPTTMSPVAVNDSQNIINKPRNFFYSPEGGKGDVGDNDEGYKFAKYKVCRSSSSIFGSWTHMTSQPFLPDVHWGPSEEVEVVDRGLFADPAKKSLLSSASKVFDLTPTIGTELHGIDLRQLTDAQKDEL